MSGLQRSYIYVGRGGGPERLVTENDGAFIFLRSSLAKELPNYEYDLEDYFSQMLALLPTGPAWDTADTGLMGELLYALVAEFERVSDRIVELEHDAFPQNTTQLLEDWERVLGLPDECAADITQSTTERRAAVITRLTTQGEPSPVFFQNLALSFGYSIDVIEHFPARAGIARVGESIDAPGNQFTWTVRIPGSYTQSRRAIIGDARIGDRIATWGDGSLECLIRQYNPAHTTLKFIYE